MAEDRDTDSMELINEKLKGVIYSQDTTITNRKIADYLLVSMDSVAFNTAEEIAKEIGVSQSAITRFTTAVLGFGGFAEFRNVVKDNIRHKISGDERYDMASGDINTIVDRILIEEIELLKQLSSEISAEKMEYIASQIAGAEKVCIIGLRTAVPAVLFFEFFLSKIHKNVFAFTSGGTDVYQRLYRLISEDTVFLNFVIPRYPREMIEIIQFLKQERARFITIADSRVLESRGICECDLVVPISMTTLFDSCATTLCLSNILIHYIGRVDEEKTQSMLIDLEKLLRRKQIFYTFDQEEDPSD